MPIGLFCMQGVRRKPFELCPGDRVVLYTDGLSETRNPADEEFGSSRLAEIVQNWRGDSAARWRPPWSSRCRRSAGGMPRADDESVMVIRRL